MTERNKTERTKTQIKQENNNSTNMKKYKSFENKIFLSQIPSKKSHNQLSKVILKGKLFSLINKSNIMTEEQFNEIKIKLSLSQLEKFKISRKNLKKQFYYAQKNPNILSSNKNPNKFEDDYINMKDLLKKFSQKEQNEILSFPQFFQLNSNEFLKEIVEEKHKNLYEIIGNEENKEIELKNYKIKQREELNSYKTNYHNRSRKTISKRPESSDITSKINNNNSNESTKNKNNLKSLFNTNKKFFSRNNDDNHHNIILSDKIFRTFNNNNTNNNSLENKKKKINFQGNIWNKSKISYKELEDRINKKYEKLKKRKELMIIDKEKKMEEIKERNIREQRKKEKERKKMYQEKKFIDYISNKLKQNYNLKEMLKKEKKEKTNIKEIKIISSINSISFDSERKSIF